MEVLWAKEYLMHSKQAQATSEKLWQPSAAQDLSLSPLPTHISVVIKLSALGFGIGRY